MENYYDYMPGGYTTLPVQIEEDGGLYIVFHAREAATSTRRIYRSYIDEGGNIANISNIPMGDIHEGFAGIDIDLITGDPFVAWHVDIDPLSADLEVVMNYDLYHQGDPGLWTATFIVFDDFSMMKLHLQTCRKIASSGRKFTSGHHLFLIKEEFM